MKTLAACGALAVVLSTAALDAEGAAGAVCATARTKIVAAANTTRRTPIPGRAMFHSFT
jgi:hypothetical protein